MADQATDAASQQYLSFRVAGADYALPILTVREIIQFEQVTRVPSMPASVRGVINLRGSVIPVVDMAARFGLSPLDATRRTCILVVESRAEGKPTVTGLLADTVSEVVELAASDLEPTPDFGTEVSAEYLLGVGKLPGRRFALLLDVERLLAADARPEGPAATPHSGAPAARASA